MKTTDHSLENLLELNGERIVIDDSLGLWVKFEVIKTTNRPQGIKYSLTLHDKTKKRIMGFDNSHEIEYGAKKAVSPKRTFDHWHYDENDQGRPYNYINAGQLLEDFWKEVDKRIEALKEGK
ncbi:TPA: hypothetical protein I8050_001010 [Legionella pneumophila]|uniref:toxin-antitoxin system TumE family protein n=1 Tax=Legionella pneumophila TaxID=446 RepID=UPI0004946E24|nr:DUF6516 family protein [Legionella pneumophila]HAT2150952.1 hypothetical protein [Legionella pneumophila]